MTRQRRRTLAAAGVFAAAAALLAVWADGGEAPPAPVGAATSATPDLALHTPPDGVALTATLDRPLFAPTRRPAPAPAAATDAADAASPASQLVAVAIGPDRSAAILRLTSGRTSVLLQGEQIDGWVLAQVAPHRVLLRSATGQAELKLPGASDR